MQLLIDDGLRQTMKFRWSKLHPARANVLDDGREHRVRFLQMIDSLAHDDVDDEQKQQEPRGDGCPQPSGRATLGLFGGAQTVAYYERYCKVVLISPAVPS